MAKRNKYLVAKDTVRLVKEVMVLQEARWNILPLELRRDIEERHRQILLTSEDEARGFRLSQVSVEAIEIRRYPMTI